MDAIVKVVVNDVNQPADLLVMFKLQAHSTYSFLEVTRSNEDKKLPSKNGAS